MIKSKTLNTINKDRFAIIIPVFNHEQKIYDVVTESLKLQLPVIVIDDGSTDSSGDIVKKIPGITVIRHDINLGKGAALKTGFIEAAKRADWAITIDADGQHDPANAIDMMKAIPDYRDQIKKISSNKGCTPSTRPIVIGMRKDMTGPDVPWTSRFGRGFSNFWVWTSGGPYVRDSQSGFRIYPIPESIDLKTRSNRFQFEVEILARAGWKAVPVIEVPVSVSYRPGTERISHFRPFKDFMRNSATFARLIFQRLFIPRFIRRRFL